MNKFGLLLCFLLAFNYSQAALPEIDIGQIYDYIVVVIKGMTDSSDYKCVNTLTKNKETIVNEIKAAIQEIKNGADIKSTLISHGMKLMTVDGLMTNCKLMDLVMNYSKYLKASYFQQVGYNLVQHSTEIEALIQEIIKSNIEGKLLAVGKIIRIVTGLTVS